MYKWQYFGTKFARSASFTMNLGGEPAMLAWTEAITIYKLMIVFIIVLKVLLMWKAIKFERLFSYL